MELQWWNKCLDSLYMMYRRCLKWKFRECTSGLKDRCLRLETLLQWWFWENLWSFESARGFEGLPMQKLRGFQLATDLSICREDLRGWEILFYKLWNFGLVEMKQPSYYENWRSNAWCKHGLKFLEALRHVASWFDIVYVQRKQLRVSRSWKLHKACFMWMAMVPLCHKWMMQWTMLESLG